jgi:hypothetical protein
MKRFTQWLDQTVERLCTWLNAVLPGDHQLVAAGYGLAGLQKGFVLPVDRRLGPSALHMSYTGENKLLKGYKTAAWRPATSAPETDCHFWAYCHISGVPCAKCKPVGVPGSINFLRPDSNLDGFCSRLGKMNGTCWFGCCRNPAGQPRFIAFFDCCSLGYPAPQNCGGAYDAAKCENWPDAKDWCFETQVAKDDQTMYGTTHKKATYYCTVVIDRGECME